MEWEVSHGQMWYLCKMILYIHFYTHPLVVRSTYADVIYTWTRDVHEAPVQSRLQNRTRACSSHARPSDPLPQFLWREQEGQLKARERTVSEDLLPTQLVGWKSLKERS